MIGEQIKLADWASPLIYPGTATKRLLIVGDSHASYVNTLGGGPGDRWIQGVFRTWPINVVGYYAPGGCPVHTALVNGGASTLAIGATQHATDGCLAPQEVTQFNGNLNGQILGRFDASAANFALMKMGNRINHAALNVKVGWWRNAASYSSARFRSGFTDDSYTEDTSGINLAGANGYNSRTMAIAASATKDFRWDSIGANVTGEWNFIGNRYELATSPGGVSVASIGNGGQTAAAYAHATTICTDARWTDWLTMFGPFDRIMFVLGTNMSAGESADITGVWKANMASFTTRLMNLNATAGATNAMGLVITGHDAGITSRYANMAAALRTIPAGDSRMAYSDTWADLPPYATLNATYLADGVHFNAAGAILVGQTLADQMTQAIGGGARRISPTIRAKIAAHNASLARRRR